MGQVLIFKEADFSANAVSLDNVYDVVKETGVPSPGSPMVSGNNNSYYNSIPLDKTVKVYAVAFTLPSDILSYFTYEVDEERVWFTEGSIKVGVCNPSTGALIGTEVTTSVNYLYAEVKAKYEAGENVGGTTQIVRLSSPVTVDEGACVSFGIRRQSGGGTNNRIAVYSNDVAYNNPKGLMVAVGELPPPAPGEQGAPNKYNNLAVTFYGEVVETDD